MDNLQAIITQLSNLALAFARLHASSNRGEAMAMIGYAIEASKQTGIDPTMLLEVYEKTFPDAPLPVVLSEEEFQAMANRPNTD